MSLVWVYRRKDSKNWYIGYAKELQRKARSLKTDSRRIAETIKAKEENDLLLGKRGIRGGPVMPIKFSAFMEIYLFTKSDAGLEATTIRTYTLALNAFGSFLKKDVNVHQIATSTLEEFIAMRRRAGLFAKSIRNDVTTLSSAFTWGIKRNYLQHNPCKDLDSIKVVRRAPDYLREDEYRKLRNSLKRDPMGDVIDFYVLTGCRRSEGLEINIRRDIDLSRNVITIGQPKQRNYRSIPISEELRPVLKRLIKRAQNELLIDMTPSALYNKFKRRLKKAGLRKDIRLHSLRHTFGTWLGARGVAPRNLQELMGHSNPMTTAIYTHAVSDAVRRDIARLKLPKKRKT
jgi:integrase/recombinase XerD